jgi:hypothetical protein
MWLDAIAGKGRSRRKEGMVEFGEGERGKKMEPEMEVVEKNGGRV